MTSRWAWNQRTEWREKACGGSRPENTRSSRDSRTGWEWKSSAWFPGGWSRQGPRCCSVPGTVANSARHARNRIAAARWTGCTRDRGLVGVLPRDVRAYKRFRATGRNGALRPNDLDATYQDVSAKMTRKIQRMSSFWAVGEVPRTRSATAKTDTSCPIG